MKLKICSLFLAVVFIFSLCSCMGVDPNVKQKETKSAEKYQVETEGDNSQTELEGFHAYGDGFTSPLSVKGVKVDVEYYALRGYELSFMMAQTDFKSVKGISLDALTQYVFCHVYFENLFEITNKMTDYRQATLKQLNSVLKKHFGETKVDFKKSQLYNKAKKKFEMWVPEYGTNVYYRIDAADANGSKVKIITTFFKELKKTTKLGRTTITVEVKKGKPIISSLATG